MAAEASAADWDAPPAAQPASAQAERGEQGATADVSWDEGPAAPEAIPAGHPDPGGWDVPAAAAGESRPLHRVLYRLTKYSREAFVTQVFGCADTNLIKRASI